jgi:hypothetical protein
MQTILLALVLLHPIGYDEQQLWFGVTERTVWNQAGYGVRVSSWCNGQVFVGWGRDGKIWQQSRVW